MKIKIEFFINNARDGKGQGPRDKVQEILSQAMDKLERVYDWPGEYRTLKTHLKDPNGISVGTVEVVDE